MQGQPSKAMDHVERGGLAPIATAACSVVTAPAAGASAPAAQLEVDRKLLNEIDEFPDPAGGADEHLWAKVAATETVILNTQAQSVGDVIAKLKVALLHSGADGWVDDALLSNDDATLFAGQTNWTCPID